MRGGGTDFGFGSQEVNIRMPTAFHLRRRKPDDDYSLAPKIRRTRSFLSFEPQ